MKQRGVEDPPHSARVATDAAVSPTSRLNETSPLSAEQQALDQRLRDWRALEAERLGMPQFFVLGTNTLRNIAVERPRTINELKTIDGISLEKIERFGAGILALCNG